MWDICEPRNLWFECCAYIDKYKEKIFNCLWNGIRVLRMNHKSCNDSAQVHKVMFKENDTISYSLDLLPIHLLQHLYF